MAYLDRDGQRKFQNKVVYPLKIPRGWMIALWIFGISIYSTYAADVITRETLSSTTLRVCADPNNLPFSNDKLEGFENKIIKLIADKLEKPIAYTWFPQTVGYVRNTLQLHECDLISGITTTNERVQNTNPYYHSIYTLVYLSENPLPTDFSDPVYKNKKVGVVAGTPAANVLARYGLLQQLQPYQLMVDTRYFSIGQQIIDDIASNKIDGAIIWGPIAGFYANKSDKKIEVVPLIEESNNIKLDFSITMAVRFNDQDWKDRINQTLKQKTEAILTILKKYHVPLLNNRGELIQG